MGVEATEAPELTTLRQAEEAHKAALRAVEETWEQLLAAAADAYKADAADLDDLAPVLGKSRETVRQRLIERGVTMGRQGAHRSKRGRISQDP